MAAHRLRLLPTNFRPIDHYHTGSYKQLYEYPPDRTLYKQHTHQTKDCLLTASPVTWPLDSTSNFTVSSDFRILTAEGCDTPCKLTPFADKSSSPTCKPLRSADDPSSIFDTKIPSPCSMPPRMLNPKLPAVLCTNT